MTLLLPTQNKVKKTEKKVEKNPPPPSSNQTQSIFSNVTSTILEGMSFGTGSAIAHNAVNKISSYIFSENKQQNCEDFLLKFENCKNSYGNSYENSNKIDNCSEIFTEYEKCRKNN